MLITSHSQVSSPHVQQQYEEEKQRERAGITPALEEITAIGGGRFMSLCGNWVQVHQQEKAQQGNAILQAVVFGGSDHNTD